MGAHFLPIEFTLVVQAHQTLPGEPRGLRVEPDVVGNLQVLELPGAQAFLHVGKPLHPPRQARRGARQVTEQVADSLRTARYIAQHQQEGGRDQQGGGGGEQHAVSQRRRHGNQRLRLDAAGEHQRQQPGKGGDRGDQDRAGPGHRGIDQGVVG